MVKYELTNRLESLLQHSFFDVFEQSLNVDSSEGIWDILQVNVDIYLFVFYVYDDAAIAVLGCFFAVRTGILHW